MSYSRWSHVWPGGGASWYIYDDYRGTLFIMPPGRVPIAGPGTRPPNDAGKEAWREWDGHLSYRDARHLRDILNNVLEDSEYGGDFDKTDDQICMCEACEMTRGILKEMKIRREKEDGKAEIEERTKD